MSSQERKESEKVALTHFIEQALKSDNNNPIKDHLIQDQAYENAQKQYANKKVKNNDSLKLLKFSGGASPIAMGGLAAMGALPGLTAAGAIAATLPVSAAALGTTAVAGYAMKIRDKNKFKGSLDEKVYKDSYNHDRQKIIVGEQLKQFGKKIEGASDKKRTKLINKMEKKNPGIIDKIQAEKKKMEQQAQNTATVQNNKSSRPRMS